MSEKTPQTFNMTIRLDQLPALNDVFAYGMESMGADAENDPEVEADFRAVMALRDSFQQQLNAQRSEKPHEPGSADGNLEPR